MNTRRLSAILLIAASAAILLSSFVNAPGLYQTEDIHDRLQIIETYRTRWLANQGMVVVFGLVLIVGFALLASSLCGAEFDWLSTLGAAAIALGTISGMYFVYLQTIDPPGGYSGAYPLPENLA